MIPVSLTTLWCETARGKSIGRILTNVVLSQWRDELQGLVLDLAVGRTRATEGCWGCLNVAKCA